jgi:hypothetical protein
MIVGSFEMSDHTSEERKGTDEKTKGVQSSQDAEVCTCAQPGRWTEYAPHDLGPSEYFVMMLAVTVSFANTILIGRITRLPSRANLDGVSR